MADRPRVLVVASVEKVEREEEPTPTSSSTDPVLILPDRKCRNRTEIADMKVYKASSNQIRPSGPQQTKEPQRASPPRFARSVGRECVSSTFFLHDCAGVRRSSCARSSLGYSRTSVSSRDRALVLVCKLAQTQPPPGPRCLCPLSLVREGCCSTARRPIATIAPHHFPATPTPHPSQPIYLPTSIPSFVDDSAYLMLRQPSLIGIPCSTSTRELGFIPRGGYRRRDEGRPPSGGASGAAQQVHATSKAIHILRRSRTIP